MARPTRSSPAISRGLFRVGRHWLTSGLCLGLLAVVLVLPLLALVVEAIRQPTAWRVWLEVDRLAGLAGRSLLLAAAVVAAVMPPATFLGWLLFRTNLPGRHWAQVLFLFALVLPIAVTVCGWVLFWQWIGAPMRVEPGWRFLAAVGLHAVIALPLAT
ncbi:MAG TPA: hypothetical protein PKD86_17620, partial [Gemmatales bacterium]|nr:hypothetical protein [Gemmatales bacterium]